MVLQQVSKQYSCHNNYTLLVSHFTCPKAAYFLTTNTMNARMKMNDTFPQQERQAGVLLTLINRVIKTQAHEVCFWGNLHQPPHNK